MPEPRGRTTRRQEIPWQNDRHSYIILPATAALAAWSVGVAVAGAIWLWGGAGAGASANVAIGLLLLLVPAVCGVVPTYYFDLLGIGLGWRTLELVLQLLIAFVLGLAPAGRSGLLGGVLAVGAVWVIGIQLASDLVPFRADKVQAAANPAARLAAAERSLVRHMVAAVSVSCLFFALAGRIITSWYFAGSLLSALGAAVFLGVLLELAAWVHYAVQRAGLDPEEILVLQDDTSMLRYWSRRGLAIAVIAGILLPANLSPLSRISLNKLFADLTTKLGPLFTTGPKVRHLFRFHFNLLGSKDVGLSTSLLPWPLLVFLNGCLMLLLTTATFLTLRRLWRMLRTNRGQAYHYGDYDSIWRRFWQALRDWFRRAGRMLQAWVTPGRSGRVRNKLVLPRGQRSGRPGEPGLLVRWLFARLLRRAGETGQPRSTNETAAEYGQRLKRSMLAEGAAALSGLTRLYEQARYGRIPLGAATAGAAVSLWRTAWRGLRRLGRRDEAA